MWISKMRALQAETFLNFNLAFYNEKIDGEWNDRPLKNISPLTPFPEIKKNFDLPQKPNIPKFQLPPPNLSGVHTMISL